MEKVNIDVQLIPFSIKPEIISKKRVVVIDVLRATSVIVQAITQGALEVIPVSTVEEAFQKIKEYPLGTTLLGGEKDTQRIEGFHLGNSPREYISERVRDKRIILRTTNGTKAFHLVASGKEVMAGSFLNLNAVVERCLNGNEDLFIFPSGDEEIFSLEDTVCGGMLIDRLLKKEKRLFVLSDASLAAHLLFKRFETDLVEAFRLSRHGQKLIRLGLEEDLIYCGQPDLYSIVPIFQEGVIKII
jgi:2-phosphosulfolactate phosphatase